jgi:hypothetical protein
MRNARLAVVVMQLSLVFVALPVNSETSSALTDKEIASGVLDGTSWNVRFTPNDEGEAFADTMVFKDGYVTLENDETNGFKFTEYEFLVLPSSATFSMIQAANRFGKKRYSGSVSGNRMEGELIWEKDLRRYSYKFSGRKISPKKTSAKKPL